MAETKSLEASFAARHGVLETDLFAGTRIGESQRASLQNELSHYARGWEQYLAEVERPSDERQAHAAAHAAYDRMAAWNASMGTISRREYVHGYVDAWAVWGQE